MRATAVFRKPTAHRRLFVHVLCHAIFCSRQALRVLSLPRVVARLAAAVLYALPAFYPAFRRNGMVLRNNRGSSCSATSSFSSPSYSCCTSSQFARPSPRTGLPTSLSHRVRLHRGALFPEGVVLSGQRAIMPRAAFAGPCLGMVAALSYAAFNRCKVWRNSGNALDRCDRQPCERLRWRSITWGPFTAIHPWRSTKRAIPKAVFSF